MFPINPGKTNGQLLPIQPGETNGLFGVFKLRSSSLELGILKPDMFLILLQLARLVR